MKKKHSYLALILFFTSLIGFSQEVYQWRGSSRDGVYNEKNLLKIWPEKGPETKWIIDSIGNGYAAPVITSDRIFFNGEINSVSHLFAFDLDGKLVWKSPNGKEFTGNGFSNSFPGSRSSPTVVGDLIYVCSGNGRIGCFEKQTGTEKWSTDMVANLNGLMPYFGYSESLVVDEKNVYCMPGGKSTNVAALDRFTGKPVWTSQAMGDTISYNSPMIIHFATRNVLVTFSAFHIMGIDCKTGEMLWNQKQDSVVYKQQCNTPIFADGALYYVAGDGNGAVKLKLSEDGKKITEVWRNKSIKNYFYGFVKVNDHLFSPDRSSKLKCIDIKTGLVVDTLKMPKGGIIAANGMLICYSDNGNVNLIKVDGTKMKIISKFKCDKGTKEHFAHPVISKNVLYIRHGKALIAYKI